MPVRTSILIIDPRPAEVQALAAALAREARVTVLESVAAAWTLMQADPPELVLVDVDSADGSGYQFVRQAREHRLFCRLPLLLMSARLDIYTERACLQLGAADVLAKPLHVEISQLRVLGHLERAHMGTALMRSLRAGGLALWEGTSLHCRITDGALDMLGLEDGELQPWPQLVHPQDLLRLTDLLDQSSPADAQADTAFAPAASRQLALDLRLRRRDGRWIWVALRGRVVEQTQQRRQAFAVSGPANQLYLAGTLFDISARKQLEAVLREREAGLSTLLGSLHDLVLALDADGRVMSCHLPPEFELALPEPPWLGRPYHALLPAGLAQSLREALAGLALDGRRRSFECNWPAPDDADAPGARLRHGLASLSLLLAPLEGGRPAPASSPRHAADPPARLTGDASASNGVAGMNGELHSRWSATLGQHDSQWGQGPTPAAGALLVLRDVTEHKAEEEAVRQLAYFDPLTALPNRRLLEDRLNQVQIASQRRRRHGALLFIDLDHFKEVNDRWGHRSGDQLLVELARRLQVSVRACDTVARLGGDEFVVVLADLDTQAAVAQTQLSQITIKMLARLARAYDLDGQRHQCTASVGAMLFLGSEPGLDTLLAQADAAMYRAKAAGRNALVMVEPGETPAGSAGMQAADRA
ncbi:MAG: hypothetical protein RIQ60_137 [Pseudomonadota bacterium]